jgi:protocatechuate 3,4-dioxygenase beta subunit
MSQTKTPGHLEGQDSWTSETGPGLQDVPPHGAGQDNTALAKRSRVSTFAGPRRSLKRLSRREALGLLGVASAALSSACSGDTPTSPSTTTATTTTTGTTTPPVASTGACVVSPNETIGPYPSLSDFIRSDIRENKQGLPLTLTIAVVNTNSSCSPVIGATVDIWQCDADGNYSQYGSERTLTYLRGLQTTGANGQVTFVTIYPGWYQGRATHIHVEVTVNGRSAKVTQIAFPEDVTAAVYRSGVYASSGQNPTTNSRDGVFSDGVANEMITLTGGDTTSGYTASFQVGVAV